MKFTEKYFWLITLMSLALGFIWPTPGLFFKNFLTPILIVMMTLSCLKIDLKELKNIKKDWWRFVLIIIHIFITSSLIIYLTRGFIENEIYIGLLIAAAVPCGISIVFFSLIFGGQTSKALITTTLAHLIAPVATPAIVWLFGKQFIDISFLGMILLITKLIIIPLILAQIIRYSNWQNKIQKYITSTNTILLALLNWGTTAPVVMIISAHYSSFFKSLIIVTVITILQIAFGMYFGRDIKEDITWSVASFYKNTGLAAVIAMTSFGTLPTLGVMAYMLVTNVILAPFQFWAMRRKELL